MSVFTRAGSPWWCYDFVVEHRRFSGPFSGAKNTPSVPRDRPRKEAERAEAVLRESVIQRKPAGKPRLTLEEACSLYWAEKARHFADGVGEKGRMANLKRLLGADTFLDALTDAKLAGMVAVRREENARRKKRKVSPATINREIECLQRIMKRARKPWRVRMPDDDIEWSAIKLDEPRERIRALTAKEDQDFFAKMAEIRPDFVDMFTFALIVGKRLSEVIFLEKRKIDRAAKTARVTQKGGQEIVIALTAAAMEIVDRNWFRHPVYLFTYVCKRGRSYKRKSDGQRIFVREGDRVPFTKNGWRKDFYDIARKAKIEDFRFHDLRHTTATRILAATGNLKAVQGALDHRDIRSSARYAHTFIDDKRAALEAAEKLRVPQKSRSDAAADEEKEAGSK